MKERFSFKKNCGAVVGKARNLERRKKVHQSQRRNVLASSRFYGDNLTFISLIPNWYLAPLAHTSLSTEANCVILQTLLVHPQQNS